MWKYDWHCGLDDTPAANPLTDKGSYPVQAVSTVIILRVKTTAIAWPVCLNCHNSTCQNHRHRLTFLTIPAQNSRQKLSFSTSTYQKPIIMTIGFGYVLVEKANFYESSVLHCIFVSKQFSQIVIRNIVPKVYLSNLPALPCFSS